MLSTTVSFKNLITFRFLSLFMIMEEEASWLLNCATTDTAEPGSFSEDDKQVSSVLVDLILPDDLLERILARLPIASIFRAGCVCKKWHEIVKAGRFLWNSSQLVSHKPWYFMFTSSERPIGYAYDPTFRKWHVIELPCIWTSSWFISSSCGLFCFIDNDGRTDQLYVCNPITKCCKNLEQPPGFKFPDYNALAMVVNRKRRSYSVTVAKSKNIPGNFFQWDISIHVYNSETTTWMTYLSDVLAGWRGGDESVICDGILYFMIYSTRTDGSENRHAVITYNLSSRSSHGLLMKSFIPVPCCLTCCRLVNLKEKLVMVGGIGKRGCPDTIKGIGIWKLNGTEWQQIARVPRKYFQGFGEFDEVFASSGTDDLIYIQCYGEPSLLVFDVEQKNYKWCRKCPVKKSSPLQLFTGFCLEPRLEIVP